MFEPTAVNSNGNTSGPALPTPTSTPNKALCHVCTTNAHKYRCPACSTLTCSLRCVQSHKSATNCSGQRNKTAFVPLERYTENTLYSDYSLLEDTARTADNAARNRHSGPLHKVAKPTQFKLPVKLHKLQLAAGKRGTRVRFMSRGMKRAEDNESYMDFHTDVVHWTVQVHLPFTSDEGCQVLLTAPMPETQSVAAVVTAFADPASAVSLAHPAAHVAMVAFLASQPSMHYYWRRPNPIRGQPGRLHVPIPDANMSIKDALKNVPVLEFPVLVVTQEALPDAKVILALEQSEEDEDVTMPTLSTSAHDEQDNGSDSDDAPPEVASSAAPRSHAQQAQPHLHAPTRPPLPSPPRSMCAPISRAHASLPAKPATLPPLPVSVTATSSPASSPPPPPAAAPPAPALAANSAPWRTPTWSSNPYGTPVSANPYNAHPPAKPRPTSAQSKSQLPSLTGWGTSTSSSPPKPAASAPPAHSSAPMSLSGWGAPVTAQAQPAQPTNKQQAPQATGAMPSSDQVLALWQQLAAGQQEQVQWALAADFGGTSKH